MSTKALVSRFEAEAGPSAPNQHEQLENQEEEHRQKIDPREGQQQGNKGTGTGGRGEERPQRGSKEGSKGDKENQPRFQQTGGPLGGSQVSQLTITEQDRERIISSLGATHEYSSDDELGLMDFENRRSKRRLSNSSNASTDHDCGAKKGEDP